MKVHADWSMWAGELGDRVMVALEQAAYVVVGSVLGVNQRASLSGYWLNEPMAVEDGFVTSSGAPGIAWWKAGEFLPHHPVLEYEEIRRTPILTDPTRGSGWRGGVQISDRIIAVSKLNQYHDRLIAAVMHTAATEFDKTAFERVDLCRDGSKLIVLRSVDPQSLLGIVASICEVHFEHRRDGQGAHPAIYVSDPNKSEAGVIGLSIEPLC